MENGLLVQECTMEWVDEATLALEVQVSNISRKVFTNSKGTKYHLCTAQFIWADGTVGKTSAKIWASTLDQIKAGEVYPARAEEYNDKAYFTVLPRREDLPGQLAWDELANV